METINWQEPKKRFTRNAKPRDLFKGEVLMHGRRMQDFYIKTVFAILLLIGVTLFAILPYFNK